MWHKSHKMKDPVHEKAVAQREIEMQAVFTLDKNFQDNADALNSSPDLKKLYPIVRPLLSWLEAFLYFKPEWQAGLGMLINGLDADYLPVPKKKGEKIPGLENE